MKKQYESPFFDISKIRLTDDILGPSQGSAEGDEGVHEETGDDLGFDFGG